jgi:hypothetical protein
MQEGTERKVQVVGGELQEGTERRVQIVGGELTILDGTQVEVEPQEDISVEWQEDVGVVGALATVADILTVGAKIINGLVDLGNAADRLGAWWARAFHGVTNIKAWGNATDQTVYVYKYDGGYQKKDYRTIPTGQTVTGGADMWIPWADNPSQYNDHHATIMVGNQELAYFWQSGLSIHFNVLNYFDNGLPGIPGASQSGGDRTLVVAKDDQGKYGVAMSTFG